METGDRQVLLIEDAMRRGADLVSKFHALEREIMKLTQLIGVLRGRRILVSKEYQALRRTEVICECGAVVLYDHELKHMGTRRHNNRLHKKAQYELEANANAAHDAPSESQNK